MGDADDEPEVAPRETLQAEPAATSTSDSDLANDHNAAPDKPPPADAPPDDAPRDDAPPDDAPPDDAPADESNADAPTAALPSEGAPSADAAHADVAADDAPSADASAEPSDGGALDAVMSGASPALEEPSEGGTLDIKLADAAPADAASTEPTDEDDGALLPSDEAVMGAPLAASEPIEEAPAADASEEVAELELDALDGAAAEGAGGAAMAEATSTEEAGEPSGEEKAPLDEIAAAAEEELQDDDDDNAGNEDDHASDSEVAIAMAAELAERLKAATLKRDTLREENVALQRQLAEHLWSSRHEVAASEGSGSSSADVEIRYAQALVRFEELGRENERLFAHHEERLGEVRRRHADKSAKAAEIRDAFVNFKSEIIKGAENSRTGRRIPAKTIRQFVEGEKERDETTDSLRLKIIQQRMAQRKLEAKLKQKEKLADGLHLIDFEQLKIENQTLNEKIEERNEELLKLQKKTAATVQVLTHLREKLQFVKLENDVLKSNLGDFEGELAGKREALTLAKRRRDAVRAANANAKQTTGMVVSEELLLDFEKRKRAIATKRILVNELQQQYNDLTLEIRQYKRQLDEAVR